MPNRGVKGRIVFAEAGDPPIPNVIVAAFDLDPFHGDDPLGPEVVTGPDGEFSIEYEPSAYRLWIADRRPDIEVRVYGPGKRVLFQTKEHEDVSDDVLPLDPIRIHRTNFPTSDPQDPSWLVCHTSLDPANGIPVRLTTGNEIDWLIDGAAVFPKLNDEIEGAQSSVRFMNLFFYIDDLVSKFEFPPGVNEDNVDESHFVRVSRLERILRRRALEGLDVHVLVWELENIKDLLVKLLDKVDQADETRRFFQPTAVTVNSFESTQLLHMKAIVIDGKIGFIIGSTISRSYFTDGRHRIREPRHGRRLMIHDASLRIKGPAVRHIDETFVTVWNANPVAPSLSAAPPTGPVTTGGSVQILRTLPGEVFAAVPFGETGILEAYQRAIMKAEEYIYIEDQYLVSQDIADALAIRMEQKPDLEVILVLNVTPDIAGYPRKQVALLNQLRDRLPQGQKNRLGIFTIWSTDDAQTTFEIAPIYVHAKLAIIDGVWATVGTANLDGASLNRRQWGLILKAEIGEGFDFLVGLVKRFGFVKSLLVAILGSLVLALILVHFAPYVILATAVGVTFSLPTLVGFIIDAILKETARDSQHANPHRSRQPPRHPELNVVLYDGIADQPATTTETRLVEQLRRTLWEEHLGHPPALTRPATGWLTEWKDAANAHRTRLQQAARPDNPVRPGPQTSKLLDWVSEIEPKEALRTLLIEVDNITVLERGVSEAEPNEDFIFKLDEVDDE